MEDRRPAAEQSSSGESRDDLERRRKRESLESSRRGVLRELEATRSEVRRQSLQAALEHLDRELLKLR